MAVIQADTAAAKSLGWGLPSPALLEELRRKTRGRVLGPGRAGDAPLPEPPDDVSQAEWDAFLDRVGRDPGGLYVEYRLSGEPTPSVTAGPMRPAQKT